MKQCFQYWSNKSKLLKKSRYPTKLFFPKYCIWWKITFLMFFKKKIMKESDKAKNQRAVKMDFKKYRKFSFIDSFLWVTKNWNSKTDWRISSAWGKNLERNIRQIKNKKLLNEWSRREIKSSKLRKNIVKFCNRKKIFSTEKFEKYDELIFLFLALLWQQNKDV